MNLVQATVEVQPAGTVRTPIVSLKNISKYFGGVQALDDVSMDIFPSEVIALVGDNGAGKSTFLKVISGVNIPDTGSIEVDDQPVVIRNTLDAVDHKIQTVYQDLALCDNLSIIKNMFLGRELCDMDGRLRMGEMEAIARRSLSELGIEVGSLHTQAGQLSGGQRQAVAIARSMLGSPRVVLLDEPLANLGLIQRRQVSALIKRLRSKGYGIVVVSHDLIEVFEVADRVVIFRLGRKVAELDRSEITHKSVVAGITGSDNFLDEGAVKQ